MDSVSDTLPPTDKVEKTQRTPIYTVCIGSAVDKTVRYETHCSLQNELFIVKHEKLKLYMQICFPLRDICHIHLVDTRESF
jgi:hypothetical protein